MATTEDSLARAHGKLISVQPILQGFNHRNKNQHRTSKWWAQFDMLRRHTQKLAGELRQAVEAEAARSRSTTKSKKTARKPTDELSAVKARARWLRETYLPQVYLAFTQLSADNQHAALGLLLLGVLAEVNTAVSLVLSDYEAAETTASPPMGGEGSAGLAGAGPPRKRVVTEPPQEVHAAKAKDEDEDMGTAVTRVEAEQEMRQRALQGGANDDGRNNPPTTTTPGAVALGPEPEPISEDQGTNWDRKTKKKKKRKKEGDEFDDLFSSLM